MVLQIILVNLTVDSNSSRNLSSTRNITHVHVISSSWLKLEDMIRSAHSCSEVVQTRAFLESRVHSDLKFEFPS